MTWHLAYHCYPRRDRPGLLLWHSQQLRQYVGLFTGRKLLTFALDEGTLSPEECRDLFGSGYEFSFVANDPKQGESTSFRYQLRQLRDEDGAVFRAHAKGVNYPSNTPHGRGARDWSEAMYLACLNDPPAVRTALAESNVAGPFLYSGGQAAAFVGAAPWHYTGSFYWFRLDRLRECWDEIWQHPLQQSYYFVEVLPSLLCPQKEQAACLYFHLPTGNPDGRDPQLAAYWLAGIKRPQRSVL